MDTKAVETQTGVAPATLDIARIMQLIPHRYPFLLIDRIVDVVPSASATGIKNVSINEPHFQGHFPQRPVMPGVLIIEAMAQTAGALVVHTLGPEAEVQRRRAAERLEVAPEPRRHPREKLGDEVALGSRILQERLHDPLVHELTVAPRCLRSGENGI